MIRFTKDAGWRKMERALDHAAFESTLRRNMRVATQLNGHLAEAAVRRAIRAGSFAPNASLTIAIKGSSKPLVDQGSGIFQAITSEVIDDFRVFVGVLRADEHYDIALALHEGATISVTPAMRGMFFMLWLASQGSKPSSELTGRAAELWERMPGGWLPLKSSTTAIVIPGRPYLANAFNEATLRARVQRNWERAVAKTFRELSRR
ncbi:MAG: hypothetical protein AB7W59_00160 [Acidimicrobiia bacterium]